MFDCDGAIKDRPEPGESMSHEDPKTASFALPMIAILLVMAASVLLLISHADASPRQGRVFVQVEQSQIANR